jgi:hypothetical protein
MLEEARELAGWSKEGEALSIYQALGQIKDRRGKKGKRYGLALLLTCVLLAKMAGETTLQAIAEWIRFRSDWLQEVLPDTRTAFPCAATYSNTLRTVEQAELNQVLMDLLTRVRAEKRTREEQRHVGLRWEDLARNAKPSGRRSNKNASDEFIRSKNRNCNQRADGRRERK